MNVRPPLKSPDQRRWHRPTEEFREWWEPHEWHKGEGSKGGHREALRGLVHAETGIIMWHGVSVTEAFNTERYRREYRLHIGRPAPWDLAAVKAEREREEALAKAREDESQPVAPAPDCAIAAPPPAC